MPTTVQLEPAGISDEFYNQIMRENYDNRTLILYPMKPEKIRRRSLQSS